MKTTNAKKNKRKSILPPPTFTCPHCRQVIPRGHGHYMPASMGDKGMFVCERPEPPPPPTITPVPPVSL